VIKPAEANQQVEDVTSNGRTAWLCA